MHQHFPRTPKNLCELKADRAQAQQLLLEEAEQKSTLHGIFIFLFLLRRRDICGLIRGGHGRFHFFAPRDQFVVKLFCFGRILRGEIVLFAEIIFQIVEFEMVVLEILDQFPIAGTNDTAGCRAPGIFLRAEVAREMPVDGVAI